MSVVRAAQREQGGRPVVQVNMHPGDVAAIRQVSNQPFRAILGVPIAETEDIERGQVQLMRLRHPDEEDDGEE